jgi:hypothetical protein
MAGQIDYNSVATTPDGFVRLAFWDGPPKRIRAIATALGITPYIKKCVRSARLQIDGTDRIPVDLYLRVRDQFRLD